MSFSETSEIEVIYNTINTRRKKSHLLNELGILKNQYAQYYVNKTCKNKKQKIKK